MSRTTTKLLATATILAASLAIAWPTASAARREPPTQGLIAFAFADGVSVQLVQLPNFITGEVETSLSLFIFDPLTGFSSGSTVLAPDQYDFDARAATVVAGVTVVVASFDPCTGQGRSQVFEVTEALTWDGYGPCSPASLRFSGPGTFLFSKQRSREADMGGVLEGDTSIDLANAIDTQIGSIVERIKM